MRRKLLLFSLLFFLIVTNVSFGQNKISGISNYSIKHYTDEQGLPQNSVRAIFRDEVGFLWLATESGIVRFDGETFKTYDKSVTGLTSSRIVNFAAGGDRNKSYAVTSENELIEIKNGTISKDKFWRLKDYFPALVNRKTVKYWSVGIWDVDLELLKTEHYIIPVSLLGKPCYYECSEKELCLYTGKVLQRKVPMKTKDIKTFFKIGDGLYCLTRRGEVVEMMNPMASSSSSGTLMDLTGDITKDGARTGENSKKTIFWNNISNQVFLYQDKKCYQITKRSRNGLETKLIVSGLDLDAMNVKTILMDNGGKWLFLGSLTSGFYIVRKTEFFPNGLFNDLSDEVYYAQAPFSDNAVITPNGRVIGEKKKNGSPDLSLIPLMRAVNEKDNYTILTDSKGFIWTKRKKIVYRYSPDGRHLLNQWDVKGRVAHIYQGKDSRIWVAVDNQGLYCFDINKPLLAPELFSSRIKPQISYMSQSDQTYLWVGTALGLYRLNLNTRKTEIVAGTEHFLIRSIHAPVTSEIWFTTEQSGFYLYRNGKLISFPLDEGRNLASAHCILEDQRGFLWITTNKGIYQISKADLLAYSADQGSDLFYMHYTKSQGLLTNEFNGGCEPCGIRLKNGFFSFPSMKGLVWFVPEDMTPDLPDSDIRLDYVDLKGLVKEVRNDTIRLPHDPERIRLLFSVPYLGNRDNLSLAYKLVVGHPKADDEANWIKMDKTDLTLYLSSLRHGTYTLCVRKRNGFGINNFKYKYITFLIPPKWYETCWFRLLGLVFILVGGFMLNRLSVYYLNKRNRLLERMVETRTVKLRETLSALEDSENKLGLQMKMQSRLLAAVSHDIKTPLRSFQRVAGKIKEFQKDGKYEEVSAIGEELSSSSKLMHEFLENLLCYIKFQVYNLEIKKEPINLTLLINDKFALFQVAIAEHNNKVINRVPNELFVFSNAQLLGVIIHNLIDNAIKATLQGTIEVFTMTQGQELHLVVRDNGRGMPLSLVSKLNESVSPESTPSDYIEDTLGTGLGLIIVKELTSLIGLSIEARVKSGTEIRIIFPNSQG